jgi:hydroxypyruvate reductase
MPEAMTDWRRAAIDIWRAGVNAVDSTRLVAARLEVDGTRLRINTGSGADPIIHEFGTDARLLVVGAGKAGAGMAEGVERVLAGTPLESRVSGWINVPADCVRPTRAIHLHPARPAGVNEPTIEGCAGTERILSLVAGAGPADLALALISGGGSALLPAPVDGVSLDDKQRVTRMLSSRGADIRELNTVRKRISRVKGGGLLRAAKCPIVALVISDVIGDPLEIIASGPTIPDSSTAADALAVLERFDSGLVDTPASIVRELRRQQVVELPDASVASGTPRPTAHNLVIGNNKVACDAAMAEAIRLGFDARLVATDQAGVAEEVGRDLARLAVRVRQEGGPHSRPVCLVSGGEPIVRLAPYEGPRKGGRNQQLVLAALSDLEALSELGGCAGITFLSGGTDGEDGPTDAAGAVVDAELVARTRAAGLVPESYLAINDAYAFFDRVGGLVRTGPTHTNTMDVRVVLIAPTETSKRPPGSVDI